MNKLIKKIFAVHHVFGVYFSPHMEPLVGYYHRKRRSSLFCSLILTSHTLLYINLSRIRAGIRKNFTPGLTKPMDWAHRSADRVTERTDQLVKLWRFAHRPPITWLNSEVGPTSKPISRLSSGGCPTGRTDQLTTGRTDQLTNLWRLAHRAHWSAD